jgi:hypothetical protein
MMSLRDVVDQIWSDGTCNCAAESTPTPGEPTNTTLSASRPGPAAALPTTSEP